MLKYGIQSMHGKALELPVRSTDWPSREGLAARFERFGQSA